METLAVKYKLKRGTETRVAEWRQYSSDHKEEILERCRLEGIVIESAFLDTVGDDTYLIYFLKAKNLEKVYEIFDASQHPVDLYQKAFKAEVIEEWTLLTLAVDFETF